ncbi:MAG: glycosyltransferase [Candidatus Omnitrophota bacterium]
MKKNKKPYDILLIGNLASNDLMYAEYLSRLGFKCRAIRRSKNGAKSARGEDISFYNKHFKENDLTEYRNPFEFVRLARQCNLVLSFTGSLIGFLSYLWPLRRILRLPPVINITTGSDITELAIERSIRGYVYRRYLRFSDMNFFVAYPHSVKNILKLRLLNFVFIKWPFYFLSRDIGTAESLSKGRGEPIYFFHPSHLDWGASDSGVARNSTKGNDRFIRAFIRAVKEGLDGYCVILDRGPDRQAAKDMIKKSGVQDRFIWEKHLTREGLYEEFKKADVIVDQFDVGGLGGIAFEAMSFGKPVMMYLNEPCLRLVYPVMPPILNCYTEEEIYGQIIKCRDGNYLRVAGIGSAHWACKYGNWDDSFCFYYTLLTGDKPQDYGWLRSPDPSLFEKGK